MKRAYLSLILGLWASLACAQVAQPVSGLAINQSGQPIPFAPIRVCVVTSTGTPCTPIATIYQDYNLSIQIPNPTSADQYGNYAFYVGPASPNFYVVQVGATGSYVQAGPPSGGGGGGGVSSVGLAMPTAVFGVAGSPITSVGAFTVTLVNQAANTFLAGPSSGSAATPAFRGIAPADLPPATSSVLGIVRPDNSTIGVVGGVLSVIGGGGGGVASINGLSGPFNFTGAVTCASGSPNSCSFTGGSGGGVNPGTIGQLPYYDSISTVHGDSFLSDTAPTSTTGLLTYTGPGGSVFSTTGGGNFNFTTANASSTLAALDSQINLTAATSLVQSGASNPGRVFISTTDSSGMANAANLDLTAQESGSTANTNQGNVNISAIGGGTGTNNGNVTISANANDATVSSGNVSLVTNAGPTTGLGSNINLITNGLSGGPVSSSSINLSANGGFSQITINGSNWTVDATGDMQMDGTLTVGALTTSPGCLYSDSSGLIHSNSGNPTCASGGGSGIGGSGTAGSFALFSASTTVGIGHLTDVSGSITSTEPLVVADGSGTGGSMIGVFGAAPTSSSSVDTWWADSSGRWKMNNANNGGLYVPGLAAVSVSGDCPKFATNGIDLLDSGVPCSGGTTFTPTRTIDAGAGTGATITFVSGANDNTGWINITTGTSPTAGAGVVSVIYGGTYSTVRKCFVQPSNAATSSLASAAAMFVPQSTSSTTLFVAQAGTTALAASTAYQIFYSCGT